MRIAYAHCLCAVPMRQVYVPFSCAFCTRLAYAPCLYALPMRLAYGHNLRA
jgi:hypothetical protein